MIREDETNTFSRKVPVGRKPIWNDERLRSSMEVALSGEFEGDERRSSFKEKKLDFPKAEVVDFGLDKRLVSIDFLRLIL